MDVLPDPDELMEARAERTADELYRDGKWHCCECGDPIISGHEQAMSADPAASPVCPLCCAKKATDMARAAIAKVEPGVAGSAGAVETKGA